MTTGDDAVRYSRDEGEDLDLEHIARSSALDGDRSGHDVRTIPVEVVTQPGGRDLPGISKHLVRGDAVRSEVPHRVAPLILEDAFVRDRVERDGCA